jgi:hypothetical protein
MIRPNRLTAVVGSILDWDVVIHELVEDLTPEEIDECVRILLDKRAPGPAVLLIIALQSPPAPLPPA